MLVWQDNFHLDSTFRAMCRRICAIGHTCGNRDTIAANRFHPLEQPVSGSEVLLIAAVILVPLAIAIAVTLWTLQPAVKRAERAKRARKRSVQPGAPAQGAEAGE